MHTALQRRQLSLRVARHKHHVGSAVDYVGHAAVFFADAIRTRRAVATTQARKLTATCPCANLLKMWRLLVRVDMRAHPNSRQTLRGLTDSRARVGARIGAFFQTGGRRFVTLIFGEEPPRAVSSLGASGLAVLAISATAPAIPKEEITSKGRVIGF